MWLRRTTLYKYFNSLHYSRSSVAATALMIMAEHLKYDFGYDSSLADFAVSKRDYLSARPDASFGYIATSTLVLDTSAAIPRVLLLQRAAEDEDPNKWEPPGGACDDDDPTILHAAARELREEAGLRAVRMLKTIGEPYFFKLDDGKQVCQFNFAVVVKGADNKTQPAVKLDPKEHQQFVWATEEEVKAKTAGGINLEFTRDEVARTVLQVFKDIKALTTSTT
jgi:8-oxo-dGTP pyrophosphatase MutT (NUDIX family)